MSVTNLNKKAVVEQVIKDLLIEYIIWFWKV